MLIQFVPDQLQHARSANQRARAEKTGGSASEPAREFKTELRAEEVAGNLEERQDIQVALRKHPSVRPGVDEPSRAPDPTSILDRQSRPSGRLDKREALTLTAKDEWISASEGESSLRVRLDHLGNRESLVEQILEQRAPALGVVGPRVVQTSAREICEIHVRIVTNGVPAHNSRNYPAAQCLHPSSRGSDARRSRRRARTSP